MKKTYITFVALAIVSSLTYYSVCYAATDPVSSTVNFSQKCADIQSCANVVGSLTGQKYIMDESVRGKAFASGNLEMNAQNAELLFTAMLNANGFSRVPLDKSGTFQIMKERDARDSAIPQEFADQNTAPKMPDTWDLYTLRYKASHPEAVEHVARLARSFMPSNARIIPDEISGTLLITDSAANLKKLYSMIREYDQKISPAVLKKWEDQAHQARLDAAAMNAHQNSPTPVKTQ
jgi:type II secretory pathway component GspD/PulD (secretin)